MSITMCTICLRADLKTRNIEDALLQFHDELTDFDVHENPFHKYCSICEHLLRKFYNFTLKCREAQAVLKAYQKSKKPSYPNNLHELLKPTSLVIRHAKIIEVKNDEYAEFGDTVIKAEKELEEVTQILSNESVEIIDTPTQRIEKVTQKFSNECVEFSVTPTQPENDHDEVTQNNNLIGLNLKVRQQMLVLEPFVYRHENEFHVAEYEEVIDNCQLPNEINGSDLLKEMNTVPSPALNVSLKPKTKLKNQNLIDKKQESKLTKTINKLCKKNLKIEEMDSSLSGNDSDAAISLNSDSDDDSPAGKIIKAMKEQIQLLANKNKVNDTRIKKPKKYRRDPLKYQTNLEKVFKIEMFTSKQDSRNELNLRKTSKWFLDANYKCEICISVFRHRQMLDYHKRWHEPSAGDYECDVCQMRFRSQSTCTSHTYKAHYAKFTCKVCSLITYYISSALKHCSRHLGARRTCKICNKTKKNKKKFRSHSTYNTHMMECHNAHVCVTCARHYASDATLMRHRNRIHNTSSRTDSNATLECTDCGLKFAEKSVYTLHLQKAHRDRTKDNLLCKVCGKHFENLKSIREHRRENEACKLRARSRNTLKFKVTLGKTCSDCGIEITSKLRMSRHMKMMHPDSEYVRDLERRRSHMCETCGKCFMTVYYLRDHVTIHKGLRPYQCEICPARFAVRKRLVMHTAWHKPPTRQCEVCGKKFVTEAGLYTHMQTHIQDRRYKCPICNKGFINPGSMREHLRGVHYQQRRVRKFRQVPRAIEDILDEKSATTTDSDSE